jgi:hypothetical protein
MSNRAAVLLSGLALSLGVAGASNATDIPVGPMTRGGVFRCGGANFLRLGGAEVQFTAFSLKNFSSNTPIAVERVTIFDSTGSVLLDSSTTGLPPFTGGVPLGSSNNVLGPNQSTELDSDAVLPFLLPAQRLFQMELVWSALVPVLQPELRAVRIGVISRAVPLPIACKTTWHRRQIDISLRPKHQARLDRRKGANR